ncbi:hypothetical protein ELI_3451 [Eubacterium callanderi]|uniref:Uncharacterized protein n=1 Tax=Eubacterium callanderi TaxID=53442 RepID=E3GFS6_9FIRM|nr:hypothetical protein ELI_3451 [Eubacterium callanderi]
MPYYLFLGGARHGTVPAFKRFTEKQKRNKSIKKAREIFKFHELLSAIKY